MDPIGPTDRLVAILRERLLKQAKTEHRSSAPSRDSGWSPLKGVKEMATLEAIDDRQLHRSLVQAILAEHLGTEVINDAKFQHVVGQVSDALAENDASAELLKQATIALRVY